MTTANTEKEAALPHQRLLFLLSYDESTGVFTRRVSRGPRKAGDRAGEASHNGYLAVMVDGNRFLAHRLAWFYVKKSWPVGLIDHKNGLRDDNRIGNLRDTGSSENMQNRTRKANRNSGSGVLGVWWSPRYQCWRSSIGLDGKAFFLGYFPSVESAKQAYDTAKALLHYADERGVKNV